MMEDSSMGKKKESGVSRRGFIRGVGLGTGALGSGVLETAALAQQTPGQAIGPEAVPISLKINGKSHNLQVEPRVTLLDALRHHLDYTGAKKVCDRGTCGACTVIMDGKAVYACSVLAIDAQGRDIQTVEGLTAGARPHPIVPAFVEHDAQQCGYCTPGFVVAAKAFLDRNPSPTYEQVKEGLGGNLCRCGTYVGVRQAVLDASKQLKGARPAAAKG
jgi:xanthine dehydrogenase YagT iron-sulfur-binding subunit